MSASAHTLSGTGIMIRLVLRRDRVRIPIWIAAIVGFTLMFLPNLKDLYPDAAARQARAAIMENPATRAMTGPGYGLHDYTFGAMVAHEYLGYTAIAIAIMSVLLVIRHTRAEEETGRAELVRAATIGRHAALTAALTTVVATNLVIGALCGLLMPVTLDALDVGSSWLYGMSLASVGIVFAAVAAVTAQITYAARGAIGLGMAVLGFSYATRAVGDASWDPMAWLSPIGWAQRTRSYVDDRWWPLLVALGVSVLLVGCALALSRKRDVGAGLVAPRLGRAHGGAALAGPFGLAWRLQRATLLAWGLGLILLGSMYGSVVPEVETFVRDNKVIAETITRPGTTAVDSFLGIIVMLLALIAGGYVLQSALRANGEEHSGRGEPVLSAAVGRTRFLGSHLAPSLLGGPAILLLSTGALALTAAATAHDTALSWEVFGAATAYIPALWLLTAAATTLYGWLPKLVHLVWIVLGYGFVVGMLGAFLDLPDWTLNLSPFHHVPQWPSEDITAGPLLAMTAVAAALLVIGAVGFRRRDLT